jgi:transcriptional regulator GlxA family with amidase domain
MVQILLMAEERMMASHFFGFMDAFSIANMLWQRMEEGSAGLFAFRTASLDGRSVRANGGLEIRPDGPLDAFSSADLVIVPSFFMPMTMDSAQLTRICGWLRARHNEGIPIASSCTGAFLLAEAGLLTGRTATTNWMFATLFNRTYPDVKLQIDRIFTEDSGVYCTASSTAYLDLCLHLIRKFGSAELARQCARALLADTSRSSQLPFMVADFRKHHKDAAVLKSQLWMENHYAGSISMEEVAEKAGIGSRHFKRRFRQATGMTPLGYLQSVRIEKAKERLETTDDSVHEIIFQVGYEDIHSFRRLFRQHTGMTPKEYRSRFSHTQWGMGHPAP